MVSLHPSLFWTEVDVDLLNFQYDMSMAGQTVCCHLTVHPSIVHRQDILGHQPITLPVSTKADGRATGFYGGPYF